jgi:hypothetical protein
MNVALPQPIFARYNSHMLQNKLMVRYCGALFVLGLVIGGAAGAALHKETIVVRPNVADTPAALSSVNLMIDFGDGKIKTWNTVSWHEAMSILNLVETVTSAEAIPMLTRETKEGPLTIDSIDGFKNDTQTRTRWQYWVNNTYEPRIASKYYLKPGDIVVWKYVAEQPK